MHLDRALAVRALVIAALLVFVVVAVPDLVGADWITTFTSVAIYSLAALGFGLLYGRVGLISLEGRKTGDVAAVQQVTETDEELVLISEGGQVIRTETNTINRYSSGARGVIVMRLAEGDRVAAIAAFRPGLAERDGMGDDGDPESGGPGQAGPSGV